MDLKCRLVNLVPVTNCLVNNFLYLTSLLVQEYHYCFSLFHSTNLMIQILKGATNEIKKWTKCKYEQLYKGE